MPAGRRPTRWRELPERALLPFPLSDADLAWLIDTAGASGLTPALLRSDPDVLVALTEHASVLRRLLRRDDGEPSAMVSPSLLFLALLSDTAAQLGSAAFLAEPQARGAALPVFDVDELRAFARVPAHRLFLAELLASYVRVESGSRWVRSPAGWKRRRYSDLDPLSLAERGVESGGAERVAAMRRLGDLALFLSGVFNDHAATQPLEPRTIERLQRMLQSAAQHPVAGPGEVLLAGGSARGIWLLEWLGKQAYRVAADSEQGARAQLMTVMAARFGTARRLLNALAARHMDRLRGHGLQPAG